MYLCVCPPILFKAVDGFSRNLCEHNATRGHTAFLQVLFNFLPQLVVPRPCGYMRKAQ